MSDTENNQNYLFKSFSYSNCNTYVSKNREITSSNINEELVMYNRAIIDVNKISETQNISIEMNIKKIETKERYLKFNNNK